jgi:hypothetical protein
MIATLLMAFLAVQDVPVIALGTQPGGTITGILRGADGRPVVGVRVSAMAKPETEETTGNSALAGIVATDAEGRYRLEDIPPGQYYLVAGRVDLPTYYPGTTQISSGTIVKVTSGAVLAGYDFSMGNNSFRTERTDVFREPVGTRPLFTRVVIEDGAKVPVNSANGPVRIYFERQADGAETTVPITATTAILQYLVALPLTEFKVDVQNLPEGYTVKSMKYGTADITVDSILKMSGTSQAPVYRSVATNNGTQLVAFPPTVTPDDLTITLAGPAAKPGGVRVTGVGVSMSNQPVYMSGTRGIVFLDGTFEFRNVPPGRHTIAAVAAPGRARGTTVVVGDQDLANVTLVEVSNLPSDIQTQTAAAAPDKPAGTTYAPVAIRARVVEEKGDAAPTSGQIMMGGNAEPVYLLDKEGKFVIQRLLPGVYNVEIQMFGYATVNADITVGIEDTEVELKTQKL